MSCCNTLWQNHIQFAQKQNIKIGIFYKWPTLHLGWSVLTIKFYFQDAYHVVKLHALNSSKQLHQEHSHFTISVQPSFHRVGPRTTWLMLVIISAIISNTQKHLDYNGNIWVVIFEFACRWSSCNLTGILQRWCHKCQHQIIIHVSFPWPLPKSVFLEWQWLHLQDSLSDIALFQNT